MMREAYYAELEELVGRVDAMAQSAATALEEATTALLTANPTPAASAIADDTRLQTLRSDLDQRAISLIARQQPVAGDLRLIVACLRSGSDLARMAHLAAHIAVIAQQHGTTPAMPVELHRTIRAMDEVARQLVTITRSAITTGSAEAAARVTAGDDDMDRLQADLYRHVLDRDERYSQDVTFNIALIGRHYERYADHTVSVAQHMAADHRVPVPATT